MRLAVKIKNAMKMFVIQSLTRFRDRRHLRTLVRRDVQTAAACPQIRLTDQEKELLRFPSDIYQFRLYKKVWGHLEYGFISDGYYQLRVLPRLHRMDYVLNQERTGGNLFLDKNYYDFFLQYLKTPETVLRNVEGTFLDADYESVADAFSLLEPYEELVFKKSLSSCHGDGVRLVKRMEYRKVMEEWKEDYIVQKRIRQSPDLARWNESSVNHIRMTSLNWEGDVYILGSILQIGAPGSFCDHIPSGNGEHRWMIGIHEDGTLSSRVIEPDLVELYHDFNGKKVDGRINKYQRMKDLVKKEHLRFPHHKIIGWDLTLDENENIICIEYNAFTPGIIKSQYVLGPILAQKSVRGVPLLQEIMGV